LLWREGCDDFFEARIAAERIERRIQTQYAVGWTAWDFRNYFELLDGQIAFASPRVDQCEVEGNLRTVRRVFFDGHEFDCLAAFAKSIFFSPQSGIDQPQVAERLSIVRRTRARCADGWFLLCTRGCKGGLGSSCVSSEASNYTHPEIAGKTV